MYSQSSSVTFYVHVKKERWFDDLKVTNVEFCNSSILDVLFGGKLIVYSILLNFCSLVEFQSGVVYDIWRCLLRKLPEQHISHPLALPRFVYQGCVRSK